MAPYLTGEPLGATSSRVASERSESLPSTVQRCLHHMVEERAQEQPQAEALCSAGETLTYRALNDYATTIAMKLSKLDVKPDTYVALSFEHSIWAIVAMLGVLKAGAAFASIPPSPSERVETILGQLKPAAILTSPSRSGGLMQYPQPQIIVSEKALADHQESDGNHLVADVKPDNLAYAVFTSGSTGTPKGAQIEHRQICTHVTSWAKVAGINADTRLFQFSSYLFDVHLSEIFTPLCMGGTVCVPSSDDRFNNITGALRDLRVTHAVFVPSLLSTISPEDVDLERLQTLVMLGEKSPAHVVDRWTSIAGLRVINAYGPAECTPLCCALDMSLDGAIAGNIGRPMGANLWIVNPSDPEELLPNGQEGEMLIEGPLVGRGYMNDAKKTAAVFIPPPIWLRKLRAGTQTRLYRTGDLCRYTDQGTIDYIGRNDLQVKIRGQRFELGDVEHHLRRALPKTADLAVELAVSGTNHKQSKLIAFVCLKTGVSQQEGSTTAEGVSHHQESIEALQAMVPDLRDRLSQSLPEYMVPSTFIAMDYIPRLPSAKTDRKSLRAVATNLPANTNISANAEIRPPTNAMEEKLRSVWAETFGLECEMIGIDDHFFHLGGDSIAAIRMRLTARRVGVDLTMKDIFDNPILTELAVIARTADTEVRDVKPFELIPKESQEETLHSAATQCGVSDNDIEDIYPATMNACYFMLTSEAAPGWWTSFHTFPLPADVNMHKYLECWKSIISSHQNMRSRIIKTKTAILQVVLKEEKETFRTAENLKSFVAKEKQTTMGWGESLSRYCVVEGKDDGQRYFVWTAKQAIFDAWSLHLLSRAISKAYSCNDVTMTEPLKPNQLVNYKLHADISPAKKWFHSHFAGVKPDPMFSIPPGHKFETEVCQDRNIELPHPSTSAGSPNFTVSTVSAVAWALLLGQHTGSNDVSLGLVRSGRNISLPSTDKYMGPLTSLMPLRVRLSGSQTVHELLQKYQSNWIESSAYDAYSYIELMDGDTSPGIKGTVTSTISLNIVHPLDSNDDDDIQMLPENYEISAGATQKPLNMNVFLKPDGNVRAMIRRDSMACTAELAEAFIDSFENIAKQLLRADDKITVGELSIPDTRGIKRSYFPSANSVQATDGIQREVSLAKETRNDLSALKGRSVLVTGGASGLGLATTRAFAAAGAYVTIADVQSAEEVGGKLLEDFKSQGQHVSYVHCDTTNFISQVNAFKHAIHFAPSKSLDTVALFAGVTAEHGSIMDHLDKVTPSLETDPCPPQIKCLNINLIGVYYSAYLALNYFRLPSQSSQHSDASSIPASKSLIFINSLAGYLDFSNHTTYAMSKFGARGLFRCIRSETKKAGVRCNLIAPWLVRTPLTAPLEGKLPQEGHGMSWARVEDVVECTGKAAVDEELDGRAFAVMPDGILDLHDDLEGGFAGEECRKAVLARRKAGDVIV